MKKYTWLRPWLLRWRRNEDQNQRGLSTKTRRGWLLRQEVPNLERSVNLNTVTCRKGRNFSLSENWRNISLFPQRLLGEIFSDTRKDLKSANWEPKTTGLSTKTTKTRKVGLVVGFELCICPKRNSQKCLVSFQGKFQGIWADSSQNTAFMA